MKWTEARVVDAFRAEYLIGEDCAAADWSLLTQVPWAGRVIDILLVHTPTQMRVAVEVKVTRADFRTETDEKRAASEALAHRYAYAAPTGVIPADDLPPHWGLVEVADDGSLTGVVPEPPAAPTAPDWALFGLAVRRASAAEDAIRRGDIAATKVARLRQEMDQMRLSAANAIEARDRERTRAIAARSELLALDGAQECADCGEAVTWQRGGTFDRTWVHARPYDNERCLLLRQERHRQRRMTDTGAMYLGGFAEPVQPVAIRRTLLQQDGQ